MGAKHVKENIRLAEAGKERVPDLARIVGKFNDIHETARIADTARICGWCYIGPDVEIGENTVIGNFCEINSGAKIGRDTLINSHCHLNSNTLSRQQRDIWQQGY